MNRNRGLVLLLFIVFYGIFALRTARFVDEDIAISHGIALIRGLPTIGATLDGASSIGLPVAIPAGILFYLTRDILAVRLGMAAWTLLYWIAVGCFFAGLQDRFSKTGLLQNTIFQGLLQKCQIREARREARRLDMRVRRRRLSDGRRRRWHLCNSPKTANSSQTKPALWFAIVLAFVQAIPLSYANQAQALGEFPGATLILFGLAAYLAGKLRLGAILIGAALTLKLYYLWFLPASALAFCGTRTQNKGNKITILKDALYWLLWSSLPVLALQLFKFGAYGPSAYLASWKPYLGILFQQAIQKGTSDGVNEFVHYSWRTQAYWWIGALGPTVSTIAVWRTTSDTKMKSLLWILTGIALSCALGAFHWYALAPLKWWRRALPFVVPGYATTVICAILCTLRWTEKWPRILQHFVLALWMTLALFVQIRQTLIGTWQNTNWLTQEDRHSFSSPYVESSKLGL